MKKIGWLMAMAWIAVGVSQAQTFHKYDIKSGIVTLESVMTVGGTQIKMTKIVYFDDYGSKECQETYSNGKLSGVFFSDGKDKISLSLKKKTAQKQGAGDRGIGTRIEINDMGTQKDIETGVVKKMPPMTIAGQTCEVIQVTKGKGDNPDIYAGWNRVMVYLKTGRSIMTTEIKATKLEANAVVPKEKFQVPAGYSLQ
jgi:hypothetical protein